MRAQDREAPVPQSDHRAGPGDLRALDEQPALAEQALVPDCAVVHIAHEHYPGLEACQARDPHVAQPRLQIELVLGHPVQRVVIVDVDVEPVSGDAGRRGHALGQRDCIKHRERHGVRTTRVPEFSNTSRASPS